MQNGIVKEVVSGDTLVVMGRAAGGPPPVMSVTLAGITAPRLGRRDGTSPDEPWAWAAREALRRACVGRQVAFKVEGGGGKPGAEGVSGYDICLSLSDVDIGPVSLYVVDLSIAVIGRRCMSVGAGAASEYRALSMGDVSEYRFLSLRGLRQWHFVSWHIAAAPAMLSVYLSPSLL
jgi:hypothetical protein